MVSVITWSSLAIETYGQTIEVLTAGGTFNQAEQFKNCTEATLELLKTQPQIGDPTVQKADVRKIKIYKRTLLIYRYVVEKDALELIQFL